MSSSRKRVVRRGATSVGRLTRHWFRSYFEASSHSGSAATVNLFLGVGPLVLAATGLFHAAGGNANAVARELIRHQQLTGDTAQLVRQTFGAAAHNALAVSVAGLIGFFIWGPSIARIYRDVYARVWHVQPRKRFDPRRFTVWFVVLGGLLGVFFASVGTSNASERAAAIPVYLAVSVVFWLWTPRYLLRRSIGFGALLPGALLATLLLGGATVISPFFLGAWLSTGGRYFGSFGVVIALLAWTFILTTISIACAVFSPVWRGWRESERRFQRAALAATPPDEAVKVSLPDLRGRS